MTDPAAPGVREDAPSAPLLLRAVGRILLFLGVFVIAYVVVGSVVVRTGWFGELTLGFVIMLLAALVASAVVLRFMDRRPVGALGFALEPRAARDSLLGFAVGGGLLGGAVVLLAMAGTARWVADTGTVPEYVATLIRALVTFAVAAAAEEVLFRGYAFQALVQGIGAWPAVLVSSALFSLVHAGNQNVDWIALANIFLAGIMLAVAYLRTRSLWFATGVHLGWNWVMSALLDFPVSGLQLNTPLYSARETGADWWTGGAFGPEAGLAATFFIVAGTAWMLRTPLLSESPRIRAMRPLVDTRVEERWNGR